MADPSVSLIDLKALGEPASKLIEAVRSATGVVYEPTRIRRRAKAEADARIIFAKSDIQVSEIAQRAAQRISHREVRRQENIEAVVDSAMKQLPESVTTEPVDDDWLAGFFDHCQDVSREQLQHLWGKILAGEVARPRSFSLRTLSMVKVLRPSDATLFTKLCQFIWRVEDIFVLPTADNTDEFLKSAGLHDTAMAHLRTLGLLQTGMGMSIPMNAGVSHSFSYQGWEHVLTLPGEKGSLGIRVVVLTDIGNELARVISVVPVEDYHSAIVANWRKMSFDVKELPRNETGGEATKGEELGSGQSPEFRSPEPITVD